MKKFISILLALVMTLSLSTVAFADENTITSVSWDNTQDIEATTTISGDTFDRAAIEYFVRIVWDVTTGKTAVTGGNVYKWDPNDLKYHLDNSVDSDIKVLSGDDLPEGLDNDDTNTKVEITVTNCSNADVDFTIDYKDKTNVTTTEQNAREDPSHIERLLEGDPDNHLKVHTLTRADYDYVDKGVVTSVDGRTDVYKFDKDAFLNLFPTPEEEAQTATYKGVIQVTDINGGIFYNGDTITVGTYTVTLMAGASED